MRRRARVAVTSLCTVAAALALPLPARAATVPWQVVAQQNTFVPGDVVIRQGDSLTLTNADLAVHDVTASDVGPNGPLFRSATIGPGKQAPVLGVSALDPGLYPFVCSVHDGMVGTLQVI